MTAGTAPARPPETLRAAIDRSLTANQSKHRRFLWGLCYRMTGSAADADELVQDTFARALESLPQVDAATPLEPWLTRVAVNLSRDRLRRRQTEGYVGPYLPSPLPDLSEAGEPSESPEARYGHLESLSMAFLIALESLPESQRAVLLLRDVAGLTVAQTQEALGISESNVKTTLHRAREAMGDYHARRFAPSMRTQKLAQKALEKFFGHIAQGEWDALKQMMSEGVRGISDGGGRYFASQKIIEGRDRNLLFMRRLYELRGIPTHLGIVTVNGFPALESRWEQRHPKEPPASVIGLVLGTDGLIDAIYTVVAPGKLTRLPAPAPAPAEPATT